MLDAPSKRPRNEHRGLPALPWASLKSLALLEAGLAPGSFLTQLTPALLVLRLMANGKLRNRDNVLRHLFDEDAF